MGAVVLRQIEEAARREAYSLVGNARGMLERGSLGLGLLRRRDGGVQRGMHVAQIALHLLRLGLAGAVHRRRLALSLLRCLLRLLELILRLLQLQLRLLQLLLQQLLRRLLPIDSFFQGAQLIGDFILSRHLGGVLFRRAFPGFRRVGGLRHSRKADGKDHGKCSKYSKMLHFFITPGML